MFESVLYCDPQAQKPACFCPRCGAECYLPSLICIRCERKGSVAKFKNISKDLVGATIRRPRAASGRPYIQWM